MADEHMERTDSTASTVGETVVRLRDISFAYDHTPVLRHVNLTVRSREAACVVGPNGGGKTTLFKLILGLVHPDAGEIEVFGGPPQSARGRIGYVPQRVDFDPLFPVTALEVVLMGRLGRRLAGRYSESDKKAAFKALERLDAVELAERHFAALSVGQRQRILIARALCGEPDLLLLDEPTANIDAIVEEKLYGILDSLRSQMTILMISHDLAFVSSIFDKVFCVHGDVVIHPTTDVSDETIKKIYGGEFRVVRHDKSSSRSRRREEGEGRADD